MVAGSTETWEPDMTTSSRLIRAPVSLRKRRSTVAGSAALSDANADTETNDEKRKSRYRETDHVKAFYRVNRYPKK